MTYTASELMTVNASRLLRDGDVVELEIERIGVLRNRFVKQA